jgi:hypothetical protein
MPLPWTPVAALPGTRPLKLRVPWLLWMSVAPPPEAGPMELMVSRPPWTPVAALPGTRPMEPRPPWMPVAALPEAGPMMELMVSRPPWMPVGRPTELVGRLPSMLVDLNLAE